jgi:hypothetical protein
MIICLICNFFWTGGITEKEKNKFSNYNPGRILLDNYTLSHNKEFTNNSTLHQNSKLSLNLSNPPILEPKTNLSQKNSSLQDSHKISKINDNSIYMKFYDYLKYKSGFTTITSDAPKSNSEINEYNSFNKQFLQKKENLSFLKNW